MRKIGRASGLSPGVTLQLQSCFFITANHCRGRILDSVAQCCSIRTHTRCWTEQGLMRPQPEASASRLAVSDAARLSKSPLSHVGRAGMQQSLRSVPVPKNVGLLAIVRKTRCFGRFQALRPINSSHQSTSQLLMNSATNRTGSAGGPPLWKGPRRGSAS